MLLYFRPPSPLFAHPEIDIDALEIGAEVVLNESFNVVLARAPELTGDVVSIKEVMEDGVRALVVGRADALRLARPVYAGRR